MSGGAVALAPWLALVDGHDQTLGDFSSLLGTQKGCWIPVAEGTAYLWTGTPSPRRRNTGWTALASEEPDRGEAAAIARLPLLPYWCLPVIVVCPDEDP
ncbi:hypothetical protein NDU88_000004 [Pleurodeles waltl]|uniref:Uncharacterized protein n=1 Tax=Pleurodeles waltl TaxID=8319 RepID=A0AAV7KNS2_PLEWA|nr:hypothetical protein NDU88_000004 [Pleurodeles waltl]